MSNNEELNYLLGLVQEAAQWNDCEKFEGLNCEVWHRINKLTGHDVGSANEGKDKEDIKPLSERVDKVVPYGKWKYYNRNRLTGLEEWQMRAQYNNEVLQLTEEDYEKAEENPEVAKIISEADDGVKHDVEAE